MCVFWMQKAIHSVLGVGFRTFQKSVTFFLKLNFAESANLFQAWGAINAWKI